MAHCFFSRNLWWNSIHWHRIWIKMLKMFVNGNGSRQASIAYASILENKQIETVHCRLCVCCARITLRLWYGRCTMQNASTAGTMPLLLGGDTTHHHFHLLIMWICECIFSFQNDNDHRTIWTICPHSRIAVNPIADEHSQFHLRATCALCAYSLHSSRILPLSLYCRHQRTTKQRNMVTLCVLCCCFFVLPSAVQVKSSQVKCHTAF